MKSERKIKLSPAKDIAYIAITCALLIGGQYALSFVMGVEIVTIVLICFSYVFGARRGMICAVAFSLLRCFFWGFYPTVIILYLIYYPLLAAIFGALGHIKESTFINYPLWLALVVNLLLIAIITACAAAFVLNLIKVVKFLKVTVYALLIVIFITCTALCCVFNVLFIDKKLYGKNTQTALKIVTFATFAALCTIFFTLLDDVVTPLFWGYTPSTALAYFYTSFTAMLPQTVCTIVTVVTLFLPLTTALKKAVRI